MTNKDIKNAIEYWKKTAEHDYQTMEYLFKGKKYSDSLFFGHIVLEKVLKGLVVKETGEQALYTHDLVRLARLAELGLSEEELVFLNDVNEFNIRARYPEQKLKLYRICTEKYTENKLEKITKLYKSLCQDQKQ